MYSDSTQDEVLAALVEHLRCTLKLNERNCFETENHLAPPNPLPGGDYFVTVADGDGRFEFEEQIKTTADNIGQCFESLTVHVTAYTRIQLDSSVQDVKLLRDSKRGLRRLKRTILRALVQEMLLNEDGNEILRNPLYAVASSKPNYDGQQKVGWITVTFGVDYDWNLGDD